MSEAGLAHDALANQTACDADLFSFQRVEARKDCVALVGLVKMRDGVRVLPRFHQPVQLFAAYVLLLAQLLRAQLVYISVLLGGHLVSS